MPKWDGYARFCSLARGLDVVGERWTLVVLQELLHSARRYSELRNLLPGIGSNVLSDRLRNLEHHGLVERVPGPVGQGVEYALTSRGRQLGPALALFRQWGLDELLPPDGEGLPRVHDLSYAVPAGLALSESYQWQIDDDRYTLAIDGQALTVARGSARHPVLTLITTRDFMRRWAAGETTWDAGRACGTVTVQGDTDAWDRMLLATGYPGRPPDLARRLQAEQLRASPPDPAGRARLGRPAAPTSQPPAGITLPSAPDDLRQAAAPATPATKSDNAEDLTAYDRPDFQRWHDPDPANAPSALSGQQETSQMRTWPIDRRVRRGREPMMGSAEQLFPR